MFSKFRRGLHTRGAAGFSLLELVFAMVLLSIGLLGIAAIFPLGTRFVNSGKITSTAVALSSEKMEELQSLPTNSISLEAGTYSDEITPYQRSWTITDDQPMAGMKLFQVTTSWNTEKGTREVTLETYAFR